MKAARMARARLRSSAWVKVIAGGLINTYSQSRKAIFSTTNSAAIISIRKPEAPSESKTHQICRVDRCDSTFGNGVVRFLHPRNARGRTLAGRM